MRADTDDLLRQATWEEVLQRVLATSPQVSARVAAIEKARCTIASEKAAVVPDVSAQVAVQYDDATEDTIAGVQIGMPLPIWNRNQGGIGRAHAELVAARRDLEATEQTLARRLADIFARNQSAVIQANVLKSDVLTRAADTLKLATEGYQAGEVDFLELLTVQRTYFQASLEYLAALRELNETSQLLAGCLLSGSAAIERTVPEDY
ncbi:MAG: TolC family protein [Planctomycetota bacterium]